MNSECILQDLSLVDLAKMKERDEDWGGGGGTWFNGALMIDSAVI